jgi:LysM repeat protein
VYGKYVVKQGDTLYEIAASHGMNLLELKIANDLRGSRIYPGQTLRVVSADSAPDGANEPLDKYVVRHGDTLGAIAAKYGVSIDSLRRLNNIRGSLIYPGQTLVFAAPAGEVTSSSDTEEAIASTKPVTDRYVVKPGDTLTTIATQFGMDVRELMEANSLRGSRIYPGQRLAVAHSGDQPDGTTGSDKEVPDTQKVDYYTVKSGDTLAGIAARYRTTVSALQRANGIAGSRIYPGQRLAVGSVREAPSGGKRSEEPTEYIVKRGDTLTGIADSNGVTVADLRRVNGISGSRIYPGQRLVVSDGSVWAASSSQGEAYQYLVKRGDSLYAIARRFGVTIGDLRKWNELEADALLYPGTKLTLHPNNEEMNRAIGG